MATADNRRAVEKEIASFPSYHATVEYKGHEYKIHFLALFSEKRDATPIVFSHGWPGELSWPRSCRERVPPT